MRINCHCHVFNFQTIFTPKTKKILQARLKNEGWPDRLVKLIMDALQAAFANPALRSDPLKIYPDLTARVMGLNQDLSGEEGQAIRAMTPKDADGWSLAGLDRFLRSLSEGALVVNPDAWFETPSDWLKFIYTAFMPSIDRVTDHLLDQLNDADAIVPLMMDIDPEEKTLYKEQMEQTAGQSLRHPGRVMPFLAVHPLRENALGILKKEIKRGRFIGVKLYPSLGYKIQSPALEGILDYCNQTDTPITMHCNSNGFYAAKSFRDYSHPRHWWNILGKYEALRVCFAHFGGDEFFRLPEETPWPQGSWSGEILRLMDGFKGRVFTDISYHTRPMELEIGRYAYYEGYLSKLRTYLQDDTYGSQILWGTDYWLVQRRVDEKHYWDYFSARLGGRVLDQISRDNPIRFLGLPNPKPAPNISRHLKYLKSKTDKLTRKNTAPWIRDWFVNETVPEKT